MRKSILLFLRNQKAIDQIHPSIFYCSTKNSFFMAAPKVDMRDSMVYFIAAVRQIDEWKKKRTDCAKYIHEARHDAALGFLKDPLSKSSDPDDLFEFLSKAGAQAKFVTKFPSIMKILQQWFTSIAAPQDTISSMALRAMYMDLANLIVEARTLGIRKTYISEIMRLPTMSWRPESCEPLDYESFAFLIFSFADLMTETTHIGEYMRFLSTTLDQLIQYKSNKEQSLKRKQPVRSNTPVVSPTERQRVLVPPPAAKSINGEKSFLISKAEGQLSNPVLRSHLDSGKDRHDIVFHRKWFEKTDYEPRNTRNPLHISQINYSVDKRPLMIPKVRLEPSCPSNVSAEAKINHKCRQVLKLQQLKTDSQMEILRRNISRPTVLKRIHQLK